MRNSNGSVTKKVNEYGELAVKLAKVEHDIKASVPARLHKEKEELCKSLDGLKVEIRALMEKGDVIVGKTYQAEALPITVLNPRKVYKVIGEKAFLDRVTVAQKAIKDVMSADDIVACTDESAEDFRLLLGVIKKESKEV